MTRDFAFWISTLADPEVVEKAPAVRLREARDPDGRRRQHDSQQQRICRGKSEIGAPTPPPRLALRAGGCSALPGRHRRKHEQERGHPQGRLVFEKV